MSKTPEEFAAEKCAERLYEMPQQFVKSLEYCLKKQMKTCYLAGYKAAQEHAHAALEEAEARIQELQDQLADADKVMNSSNNSNGWISVKNEMPPKDMLVYFYAPKKGFYPNVLFGFWDNDRWYVGGEVRPILSKDVTHWMYIPESPKEEPYQETVEDIDSCKRVPDYDDEMRKYIKTRGKKEAFW
jgi:hypothetical protein